MWSKYGTLGNSQGLNKFKKCMHKYMCGPIRYSMFKIYWAAESIDFYVSIIKSMAESNKVSWWCKEKKSPLPLPLLK